VTAGVPRTPAALGGPIWLSHPERRKMETGWLVERQRSRETGSAEGQNSPLALLTQRRRGCGPAPSPGEGRWGRARWRATRGLRGRPGAPQGQAAHGPGGARACALLRPRRSLFQPHWRPTRIARPAQSRQTAGCHAAP
jgi:hypothetical protein